MGIYGQIINSIDSAQAHQAARITVMKKIEEITGRRLMVYAADFSRGTPSNPCSIHMTDKSGFAELMEGWAGNSVDVLVHSPGGSAEAAEMIVKMLHATFADIRFVVPHSAKSAATMLALSGSAVLMDIQSELGPIDPQVPMALPNGQMMFVPAQTVLDGFAKAKELLIQEGPAAIPAYMPLLSKYDLHLLEICENAKRLARELVYGWIRDHMFRGEPEGEKIAAEVARRLSEHSEYLSHSRGIGIDDVVNLGIKVVDLRKEPQLGHLIWELYCLVEVLFEKMPPLVKIFERSDGEGLLKISGVAQLVPNDPKAQKEVAVAREPQDHKKKKHKH